MHNVYNRILYNTIILHYDRMKNTHYITLLLITHYITHYITHITRYITHITRYITHYSYYYHYMLYRHLYTCFTCINVIRDANLTSKKSMFQ